MVDKSFRLKIILALVWLGFTCALILWWMVFAMDLLKQIEGLEGRHQNMLVLEGGTLLALLIFGGVTLIYLIIQENRRAWSVRDFFATFSHEIKTALASLRLQAESLSDENDPAEQSKLLQRLLVDTSRVAVSVENSLFVAQGDTGGLVNDQIDWASLHSQLQLSWPQVLVQLSGDIESAKDLKTDHRVLLSLLQNLVHNSSQHGHASKVDIHIHARPSSVQVTVTDDGQGFHGDRRRLGERSFRHKMTSGSGLGLFIVKSLLRRLRGTGPEFPTQESGFVVQFTLPKEST